MDTRPTFSIITVTWRDLEGLRTTAASVQAQTDQDFEWIVIDGASDDGTPEWLSALRTPTANWSSEKDGGIYDAMNKGLDRANGSYLVFLNAGDAFAAPDVLSRVHERIDTAAPDLVYGDSVDVRPDGERLYRPARRPEWIRFGMFTSHQAMIYRRDHAPRLRYDLRFRLSGDYGYTAAFLSTPNAKGDVQYEYIALPICDFSLGGAHFTNRRLAIAEDFLIRRELLRESWFSALMLRLLHEAHHALKLLSPAVTKWLRYRSRAANSIAP